MMRRTATLLVGLLVLAGVAACAPSGQAPQGAPGASAVSGAAVAGARLAFKERQHDFGKVSASRKQEHRFAFTNTGKETLRIGEIRLKPAAPGG